MIGVSCFDFQAHVSRWRWVPRLRGKTTRTRWTLDNSLLRHFIPRTTVKDVIAGSPGTRQTRGNLHYNFSSIPTMLAVASTGWDSSNIGLRTARHASASSCDLHDSLNTRWSGLGLSSLSSDLSCSYEGFTSRGLAQKSSYSCPSVCATRVCCSSCQIFWGWF